MRLQQPRDQPATTLLMSCREGKYSHALRCTVLVLLMLCHCLAVAHSICGMWTHAIYISLGVCLWGCKC